jgi:hypothetical protein
MTDSYDLREAIDLVLADFRMDIHTSFPARVLSYDAPGQTVDVQPALMREGTADDGGVAFDALPVLYNVPLQWPRGGGFALTFPIDVGDWVHVHCAEQSTLAWRRRGIAPCTPGLTDPHGLNGCVAVPGWYPDREKLSGVNASDAELRGPAGGVVRLKSDGTVELCGTEFLALADLVEAAINAAIAGHNHAPDATAPGAYLPVLPTGCPDVAATRVRGA